MSFIDENIWFAPIPDCMRSNQRENNRISGKTTETLGRLAKEIKLLKHTIKTFRKEKAYKIDIKQAEILLDNLKANLYELYCGKSHWCNNTRLFRIEEDADIWDFEPMFL
jgi:hypothetical protein